MAAQELLSITIDGMPTGAALETSQAWIQTKAIDVGDSRFSKLLDQAFTYLSNRTNQTNFSLEIYGSDAEDGPFTLLQTVAVSEADPAALRIPAMKFFKFKYIDRGIKERWRLSGFEFTGEQFGEEY